jgi:hypothetical protein
MQKTGRRVRAIGSSESATLACVVTTAVSFPLATSRSRWDHTRPANSSLRPRQTPQNVRKRAAPRRLGVKRQRVLSWSRGTEMAPVAKGKKTSWSGLGTGLTEVEKRRAPSLLDRGTRVGSPLLIGRPARPERAGRPPIRTDPVIRKIIRRMTRSAGGGRIGGIGVGR